jgi:hypothetical protein
MAQTKTKAPSKRSGRSKKPQVTDKATEAVGNAADKAKMPLVAGGAALAGVAGGVMLGTRHAHRHSRMDKAIKLAHELQQVRQPSNGEHRSPLEVVLEGLTSRRARG